MAKKVPVVHRLAKRLTVDPDTGCWFVSGSNIKGYPTVWLDGRNVYVHALLWEWATGTPRPRGAVFRHGACGHSCVSPFHARGWGTYQDNADDRRADGNETPRRTHCVRGHEYNEENTYTHVGVSKIRRYCRACNRERMRRA